MRGVMINLIDNMVRHGQIRRLQLLPLQAT